jgi:hypothetical protein
MVLLPESLYVPAIVDAIYDYFSGNCSDASYLENCAISYPTYNVDNANGVVFSRNPRDTGQFKICDQFAKKVYHVANADLLYPP